MKVIYEKTIADKIREAKLEALKRETEIERIELTVSEFNSLRRELGGHTLFDPKSPQTVFGIKIKVVESISYEAGFVNKLT